MLLSRSRASATVANSERNGANHVRHPVEPTTIRHVVKTELGLTIESRAPKATAAQVNQLVSELRKAGRAMQAAELAAIMFHKTTETAKRRVRAVAELARPRVISFPGSDGYDLFARVPVAQVWRCIYELEDAAKTLLSRGAMYRRALHSGYRGERGDDGQAAFL